MPSKHPFTVIFYSEEVTSDHENRHVFETGSSTGGLYTNHV